jgi:hypothetical protein
VPGAPNAPGTIDEADDVAGVLEQRVAVAGVRLRVRVRVHDVQQREHLLGLDAGAPAERVPALARGEALGRVDNDRDGELRI